MNDKLLQDYLNGEYGDHVTPFYWQHGKERRMWDIPTRIRELYDDGNRSFCVESRPHPNFLKEEWWEDMSLVMETAKSLGMKVWIMDTKHYPTGYLSGFEVKHPDLRLWNIAENHTDVMGPVQDGMVMVEFSTPNDELIGVYAYPRNGVAENDLGKKTIDLTSCVHDGCIYFDLPVGMWRIVYLYRTRKGVSDSFISVIDPKSVQVLIDEVYEEHYKHLGQYFGDPFVGFFSDEPRFRNQQIGGGRFEYGYYSKTVGQRGMGLPWSDDVLPMMEKELKMSVKQFLAALWFEIDGGLTAKVRLAYMNAVSTLYGTNFSGKLGGWCEKHGIMYMGHVQEDMGVHARTGNGCAHFFRCQWGQDFSGVDVVLHQVVPGFAHYNSRSKDGYFVTDAAFYHYVLCQMAASSAHINKKMAGKAMGEIFAAYGWAEDVPMMKWQADFMLVRGINQFVPNGYDDLWPDVDCPPQLGVRFDPQLPAYQKLTVHMNKIAHLLSKGTHIANAAVLYHAESEWMNPQGYTDMSVPAKALFDAQICYDILPVEAICDQSKIVDGKLKIANETFDAFFVPYAKNLPERLIKCMKTLARKGLSIYFVGGIPDKCEGFGKLITPKEIPAEMYGKGFYDIKVNGKYPLLRFYHLRREKTDLYFFFNESATETVDTDVIFRENGICTVIDDAADKLFNTASKNGKMHLNLTPYESVMLIWNGINNPELSKPIVYGTRKPLNLIYDISLESYLEPGIERRIKTTDKLYNITAFEENPRFSGKIKYTADLVIEQAGKYELNLGKVGQIAEVSVNGVFCGLRMCAPFRFELGNELVVGTNKLEIIVSNTLVYEQRDPLSPPLLIPGSGLLGPVTLAKEE